jgi:hypothetical protein
MRSDEEAARLSSTALERLLDLPRGSARKRRLTVLTVSARHIAGTNLQHGDRLVVEPGARVNSGYLLACRTHNGIVLRRLRLPARGEPVLTPPDEEWLPLDDGVACTVIGTVLAAIRMRGNGRAQVATAPRYEFGAIWLSASSTRSASLERRRANSALLQSVLAALESQPPRGSHAARQIAAAKTRLQTLGKCLDAVDDERIYRALVREINATVLRLRRAAILNQTWVPLAYDARTPPRRAPVPSHAPRIGRPEVSGGLFSAEAHSNG